MSDRGVNAAAKRWSERFLRVTRTLFSKPPPPTIHPSMANYTQSIQNLINQFASLPGIGMRSAERIAFHLLKQSPDEAMKLARAIEDVKTRIKHCSVCYNLTESDPCEICASPVRDHSMVCIVE